MRRAAAAGRGLTYRFRTVAGALLVALALSLLAFLGFTGGPSLAANGACSPYGYGYGYGYCPPPDTTPPICELVGAGTDAAGHAFMRFRVVDGGSGIDRVVPVFIYNGTVSVEPFTRGSSPVFITVTAVEDDIGMGVEIDVFDVAGNVVRCDPILVGFLREEGSAQPPSQTFTALPQAESKVTIYNGDPGMRTFKLTVNGVKFREGKLADGEVRHFDVASAMKPGNENTITITARGKKGASALVLIADV